jgi:hypothetical protein
MTMLSKGDIELNDNIALGQVPGLGFWYVIVPIKVAPR